MISGLSVRVHFEAVGGTVGDKALCGSHLAIIEGHWLCHSKMDM